MILMCCTISLIIIKNISHGAAADSGYGTSGYHTRTKLVNHFLVLPRPRVECPFGVSTYRCLRQDLCVPTAEFTLHCGHSRNLDALRNRDSSRTMDVNKWVHRLQRERIVPQYPSPKKKRVLVNPYARPYAGAPSVTGVVNS